MNDFLAFRKMLTPLVIQAVFWTGAAVVLLGCVGMVITGGFLAVIGLFALPAGLLLWRVYCEAIILFFRMYDTLTEVRDSLPKRA